MNYGNHEETDYEDHGGAYLGNYDSAGYRNHGRADEQEHDETDRGEYDKADHRAPENRNKTGSMKSFGNSGRPKS